MWTIPPKTERALLEHSTSLSRIKPVATVEQAQLCRDVMSKMRIDGIILDYIVDLVRASRDRSHGVLPDGLILELLSSGQSGPRIRFESLCPS